MNKNRHQIDSVLKLAAPPSTTDLGHDLAYKNAAADNLRLAERVSILLARCPSDPNADVPTSARSFGQGLCSQITHQQQNRKGSCNESTDSHGLIDGPAKIGPVVGEAIKSSFRWFIPIRRVLRTGRLSRYQGALKRRRLEKPRHGLRNWIVKRTRGF